MSIQPDSKQIQQGEPQIRVKNLNVSYVNTNKKIKSKYFHILKNINLDFNEGQITAILGTSGGKTTFVETLKGNVPIRTLTSGEITYDSQKPKENEKLELHHTYENWLIQSSLDGQHEMQITEMIVMDFLMLIVGYTRSDLKTHNEKELVILDVLDQLDISDNSHSLIKSLSGGQQKRLKIAESILVNKEYILLDDPTSGLDDMSAYNILKYLKKLCDEQNKTIIITINQPNRALFDFIDHLVMIHNGRVFFSGKESEAISHMEKYGILNTEKRDATFFLVETANSKDKIIIEKLEEMIRDYITEESKELKCNEKLSTSDSKMSFKHIFSNLKFILFHNFFSWASSILGLFLYVIILFFLDGIIVEHDIFKSKNDTELNNNMLSNNKILKYIIAGIVIRTNALGIAMFCYIFCSNSRNITEMIENIYFTQNSYDIANSMTLYLLRVENDINFILIIAICEKFLDKKTLSLILLFLKVHLFAMPTYDLYFYVIFDLDYWDIFNPFLFFSVFSLIPVLLFYCTLHL